MIKEFLLSQNSKLLERKLKHDPTVSTHRTPKVGRKNLRGTEWDFPC